VLLNNKADPNTCCERDSPLYTASHQGHAEIVELLLNNKYVPNICCVGEYPYYIASRHGHAEMVKRFIIQQQFDNLYMTVTRSDV
jgi:ankyrin repeat protein